MFVLELELKRAPRSMRVSVLGLGQVNESEPALLCHALARVLVLVLLLVA